MNDTIDYLLSFFFLFLITNKEWNSNLKALASGFVKNYLFYHLNSTVKNQKKKKKKKELKHNKHHPDEQRLREATEKEAEGRGERGRFWDCDLSVKSEREEREKEKKRENKIYYFLLPSSYSMVVYILFKVAKNFSQPTHRWSNLGGFIPQC